MSSLSWHGDRINADIEAAIERGLLEAGEMLAEESGRIVPIEEGTLLRSRTVTVEGDTVAVAYDTPYAARQHEDTSLQHDDGRQAKYLEEPLRQHGPRGLEHVAAAVRRVTR